MWIALASLILAETGYILTTGHILDALLARGGGVNTPVAALSLRDLLNGLYMIQGGQLTPANTLLSGLNNTEFIVVDIDKAYRITKYVGGVKADQVFVIVLTQSIGVQDIQSLNDISLAILFSRATNRTNIPMPIFLIPGQDSDVIIKLVDALINNGANLKIQDGNIIIDRPYVLVFRNGRLESVYPLASA